MIDLELLTFRAGRIWDPKLRQLKFHETECRERTVLAVDELRQLKFLSAGQLRDKLLNCGILRPLLGFGPIHCSFVLRQDFLHENNWVCSVTK